MALRFLLFVCLQALYLQNAYSQAINIPEKPTEVTVSETMIENLDNQPSITQELSNQNSQDITPEELPQKPLEIQPTEETSPPQKFGKCGRPIHLCTCGKEVTVSDSYSQVALNQPENVTVCSRCGLSMELSNCGQPALPGVGETIPNNQESNTTVCPRCGLSVELCNCGLNPVVVTETDPTNQENITLCPHCGLSIDLCNCSSLPEVTLPQPMCPNCGNPIHLCICGFQSKVAENTPVDVAPEVADATVSDSVSSPAETPVMVQELVAV